MSKNPFVNCKSRKRRKIAKLTNPIPKEERPYCPRTMVRYDNTKIGYPTVWVCKMCMRVVLSEKAVPEHIEECKKKFSKTPLETEVKNNSPEDSKYICDVCDRVFSRKVALKQHQEIHNEKLPSDIESDMEANVSEQPTELSSVAETSQQLESSDQCESSKPTTDTTFNNE